ncbi:MAG: hypothetical protein ACRDUV_02705 [Pseudonocardiaceae bacterium]
MTLQETVPQSSRAVGSNVDRPLSPAILGRHAALGRMLDAAASPCAHDAGPRCTRQLADLFMASTCRHLVAVEECVLPIARRLPDGRETVAAYLMHVRELEEALHVLQARLYGEAHASRLHHQGMWPRIRGLLWLNTTNRKPC